MKTRSALRHKILVYALRIIITAALIGVWQLLISGGAIGSYALATPAQVLAQLIDWFKGGSIWAQIGHTFFVFAVGMGIGFGAGTILGILSGVVPFIRNLFGPWVAFFNSLPRPILIPFFAIVFGYGYIPGLIVTALVVFFLVYLPVRTGVEEIQGDFIQNATMLGGSWFDLMRTVYLPGAAVWLLSAARVSVGFAFQTAIVTEFFGSTNGLGFLVVQGQSDFDAREILAAVVLTAIIAYLIDISLKSVEHRYIKWDLRR